MRDARRSRGALGAGVIVAVVLLAGACSDGGDESAPGTVAPGTTTRFLAGVTTVPEPVSTAGAGMSTTSNPTAPPTPSPADTGVPGLDSEDAFCAAWSRFGGSWQVVLAATAFGDPDEAARLEVIASTVAGDAYGAIFAAWPDELAGEQATVADAYFGAFQRRSADAFASRCSGVTLNRGSGRTCTFPSADWPP